jgi:hypothetical protein
MPGLTPQRHLDILLDHLAEAERQYAAGIPYPDKAGGNWPSKIETIKKHIAQAREIIANDESHGLPHDLTMAQGWLTLVHR